MKTALSFRFALVLLIGLSVAACKKTDEVNPSASIVGTWQFKSLTVDPAFPIFGSDLTSLFGDCFTKVSLKFNADGTITSGSITNDCKASLEDVGLDASTFSKWSISGNKITITETNGAKSEFDLEIAGNSMKWKVTEDIDLTGSGTTTKTTITLSLTKQ